MERGRARDRCEGGRMNKKGGGEGGEARRNLIRLYINTTLFWNNPARRADYDLPIFNLVSSSKKKTDLYPRGTVSLAEITWIIGVSIYLFFSHIPSYFDLGLAPRRR